MVDLMTVEDVAKALQVSIRTVQRLVARRQIEVIRPAGLDVIRFRRAEIERLIQEGTIAPARYWTEKPRSQLRRV